MELAYDNLTSIDYRHSRNSYAKRWQMDRMLTDSSEGISGQSLGLETLL